MARTQIQHTAYKKGARGTARDHADYIAGLGRNAGKEDVIFVQDGNLPKWAEDAGEFFSAADEFERDDYTTKRKTKGGEPFEKKAKARAYTEFEWSIPRGIKDPVAWAVGVAQEALGAHFVFRLAVHDAPASDGGRNINMHLMFSDRKLDGIERGPELFFKRAKTGTYRHRKTGELVQHDPATGGTKKDREWNHKSRPKWARHLFERHVQLELPDFKLSKSKSPEPKIGPRVKNAGMERKRQRLEIEAAVMEMRLLRTAIIEVEGTLTQLQREPEMDRWAPACMPPHQAERTPFRTSSSPPAELDVGNVGYPDSRGVGSTDPRWPVFEEALRKIGRDEFGIETSPLEELLKMIVPSFVELADALQRQGHGVEYFARLTAEHMHRERIEVDASTGHEHVPIAPIGPDMGCNPADSADDSSLDPW